MINPTLRSVTLAVIGTEYNLYTLLSALYPDLPHNVKNVRVQVSSSSGAAKVNIGNPGTVAATDCGAEVYGGQVWDPPAFGEANEYDLRNIALKTDTTNTVINVAVVLRLGIAN